ncbi:hypothetical protein Hanom_Chr05g00405911 [Helianthus anomalus]
MIPESPPLRDAMVAIEESVPILSTNEIVQWKRMYENPTRSFTFPEGIYGGIKPLLLGPAESFYWQERYSHVLEMALWGLLQGDCKDVKFVVGDKVEPSMSRGVERRVAEGLVQAGESAVGEKDEEASSNEKKVPPGSLQAGSSSNDVDEDVESRLAHKRKAFSPKQVHAPHDIWLRLRSASGQKAFPATLVPSELPPNGVNGS